MINKKIEIVFNIEDETESTPLTKIQKEDLTNNCISHILFRLIEGYTQGELCEAILEDENILFTGWWKYNIIDIDDNEK